MPPSIPQSMLVAAEPFAGRLAAERVAGHICEGLRARGREGEACPLPAAEAGVPYEELLADIGFDARMRAARAVVIAADKLDRSTLAGSLPFEIATRARQAGVPAYAVARSCSLDSFDARILDLQVILTASAARGLLAAGRRLAELAWPPAA